MDHGFHGPFSSIFHMLNSQRVSGKVVLNVIYPKRLPSWFLIRRRETQHAPGSPRRVPWWGHKTSLRQRRHRFHFGLWLQNKCIIWVAKLYAYKALQNHLYNSIYIYTMQSILKPYLLYDHVYATCIITHLSVVVRQVSLRRDLLFKDDAAVPRRRYRQPPELMAKFGRKTMHPLQPYSMRFELRYSCCLIPPTFWCALANLRTL